MRYLIIGYFDYQIFYATVLIPRAAKDATRVMNVVLLLFDPSSGIPPATGSPSPVHIS
jgi:hypothetical protein